MSSAASVANRQQLLNSPRMVRVVALDCEAETF